MRAEISKRPFSEQDEKKHYQSVNLQMGRVQLDSDWNEAFEILLQSRSRYLTDIIGDHGSPNDGFRVDHDLILDHLDAAKGWAFSGAGSWKVDHLSKTEGFGSFRISGNGTLQRPVPALLANLAKLRQILEERGAAVASPGTPRLLLYYKVSATEPAGIQLEITKADALDAPIATDPVQTYPCDDWQVLELDLATLDLSEYENLAIHVATNGTVRLDRLALAPGLAADTATDDFYIQGGDGSQSRAGRYYAAGNVAVKEGFETYQTQQDYPEPPPIDLADGTHHLAYLDVWRRTITAVEDTDILEVALGGPDTTSREQLVSQVKVLPDADCGTDIAAALRPGGSGTLSTGLSPDAEQGECDFKPELDYTGLENALYRIEIHQGGDENTATFKWSRNNGAELTAVAGFDADTKSVIVPDDRFLCHGDWIELCDDVSDLAAAAAAGQHGKLAKIIEMTHQTDGVKILLDNEAGDFSTLPFSGRTQRHAKLRKWHGVEKISDYVTFEGSGLPDTELEHGIRIAFSQEIFYHGDYWQFTARVNTRTVEALDHEPPMGPLHYYAPLGRAALDGTATVFETCRKIFPPLNQITANHVLFDSDCCEGWSGLGIENVQQALEYLCRHQCCDKIVLPGQSIQDAIDSLGPAGGAIYLAPGIHMVQQTIRIQDGKDITIKGEGASTRVIYLPREPEVDEDAAAELRAAVSDLEEQIQAAVASGDADLAAELRAERRRLLVQYYAALGYAAALIEVLRAIDEVHDQISAAGDDPDAVADLNARLAELELQLAGVRYDLLDDLFRVAASRNITLTGFLMAGIGADSLVAITEASNVVEVSRCDLLSLPDQKQVRYSDGKQDYLEKINAAERIRLASLKEKPRIINPCIRISSGCRINIEANQMAGRVGLIHEGAYNDQQVPLIDEFNCIGNRIRFVEFGVILMEARRSRIEHNRMSDVALGLSEEDQEALDQLLDEPIDPADPCDAHLNRQIDEILDVLRRLYFGCAPRYVGGERLQGAAVTAYILRKSVVRKNALKGITGLHLFYSADNRIEANRVLAHENALVMIYNFKTRVRANDFKIVARKDMPQPGHRDDLVSGLKDEAAGGDASPAAPAGLRVDAAEADARPADEAIRHISIMRPAITAAAEKAGLDRAATVGRFSSLEYPAAVMVHFSDRLRFKDNRVSGPLGWLSAGFEPVEFIKIIQNYGNAWILASEDAAILLVRRFVDLMGLTPALRVFETTLKIFAGGREVDWVAYWLESAGAGSFDHITKNLRESAGFLGVSQKFPENPFVKILVSLFNRLLELQVVSRSRIAANRLDVRLVGIGMRRGLTLGGVRISANRISGAADTGVLWQALPVLNNPEFNGVLLELVYQVLIYFLNLMIGFLNLMLDFFEGSDDADDGEEQSVSAIYVLAAVFMLYGVGTICPNLEADGSSGTGDDATEPENPFVPLIRALIEALQDLNDQLQSEEVRASVKDLAASDDRLAGNQIHGAGDGIHTNVANTLIASNQIGLWPGKAAIAELFAMGRFFAAHAQVVGIFNDLNDGAGDQQASGHTAVAALGNALLSLNPDLLRTANDMLAEEPSHWIGLDDMFAKVEAIAAGSDFASAISPKIAALGQAAVQGGSPDEIVAASQALISELAVHFKGYGMIIEAPGVQVVDNKVESKAPVNIEEKLRAAPGGILMTCGGSLQEMLAYFLLLEESFPLLNIGAQGTRFDRNSLQWGSGYGLSFSSLPMMVDLKIENNEIQNHGLAGIYCDSTTLSALFGGGFDIGKLFATKRLAAISVGNLQNILALLLAMYKLKIVGNEVNQCFTAAADEFYTESPPFEVYRPSDSMRLTAIYATIFGGLMVRNALEIHCALNRVRFCGKEDDSWNAYGTVFIDCYNLKFEGNKILSNGRSGTNDQYYPRGGSLFLGGAGTLSVSNNDFSDNDGVTLLVVPRFSMIGRFEYWSDQIHIDITAPWYAENQSLARVLAIGNVFDIRDALLSRWSKIHMGVYDDLADLSTHFIDALIFSQNQVSLPRNIENDAWQSTFLRSAQLTFNGNIISGPAMADKAMLVSSKGIGLGNVLHKEPATLGNINLSAGNNQW